ncbi:MAG: carboxypeptidase M32 [Clostridia bacterium]|nr:carboxypeptidase M32 [Clostridia bacterium]
MSYTVESAVQALRTLEAKNAALGHAMGIIGVDAVTVAPSDSGEGRGRTMGILSAMEYELVANPENIKLLDYLDEHKSELDPQIAREAQLVRKSCEQISRIPADEYTAYAVLLNEAQEVWEKAKNTNDFPAFAPCLEKIIEFNKKFAGYYNPDLPAYDALLNEYEEGMTTKVLDEFFAKLRNSLTPLIAKIGNAAPVDDSFLTKNYPIDVQRKFSDYLMDVLGTDKTHCVIGETEHPFTANFGNKDVRVTTHYYEDSLDNSMYSVIHECGHALYELGCGDQYNYTAATGGVSMGIHESQSRFYENIIGRSEEFIAHIYPRVQEFFPEQLKDVTAEMFHRAVNKVTPSLIRTQADELTYCMHIMVRYEIEKQLIGGALKVNDIPAEWNRLYKEYLGVDVPDDTRGCLQDSHWSGGSFGYFPSYALGSAYGAQMLSVMENQLGDIWADVKKGDLSRITGWLKENIHQHASMYRPGELFEKICGKFDAQYYVDHLTKKYTELYNL